MSLTFAAADNLKDIQDSNIITVRGDVVMGAGSVIRTGAQGSVTFTGATATILGSIYAPAGSIKIGGKAAVVDPTIKAPIESPVATTVDIGPKSVLSTAGMTLLTPDSRGYRTGAVLPGGSISVSGNIVAEAGSRLDASGASGILDVLPAYASLSGNTLGPGSQLFPGTVSLVPLKVDSNGGSITFAGTYGLFVDASLRAAAGGPSALGGSLSLSSGHYYAFPPDKTADPTIIITQSRPAVVQPFYGPGQSAIDRMVLDAQGNPVAGPGYIAADRINSGGFDSVSILGTVEFKGESAFPRISSLLDALSIGGTLDSKTPVTIHAGRSITIGTTGLLKADCPVVLSAPYVALGKSFVGPETKDSRLSNSAQNLASLFGPTFGPGKLTIRGSLIDVGNLSLLNIGQLTLAAPGGDVRGDGTLDVAGNISVIAGQVYPTTACIFTITAYDYVYDGKNQLGSVTFLRSGQRQLPYSAAGQLNVFASSIWQGGVLRAPFGSINLGWDGTVPGPSDYITGWTAPITQNLTLATRSITSVSGVDPLTGQALILPYGYNKNGIQWIDPTGTDITNGLLPGKEIWLKGMKITDQHGSLIDIRGGGDLYAYRWVTGLGGSTDILSWGFQGAWASKAYSTGDIVSYKGSLWLSRQDNNSLQPVAGTYWRQLSQSLGAIPDYQSTKPASRSTPAISEGFAVIPSYQAAFAPVAPVDPIPSPGYYTGHGNDPASGLSVGDRVYLNASSGLPAGTYTLLPARYALLPGAFMVTPRGDIPQGSRTQLDGSALVSGYRFNDLGTGQTVQPLVRSFEVAPESVVRNRAQYDNFYANTSLLAAAQRKNITVPRLPIDSGHLVFLATQTMTIEGSLFSRAPKGGLGGLVDIANSPTNDIFIEASGKTAPIGSLSLDSTALTRFGADSLLIGGYRTFGDDGTSVTVTASRLTVDNAGSPLSGPDVILVANKKLVIAGQSVVKSSGATTVAPKLLFGTSDASGNPVAGSGDGLMVRVSTDASVESTRTGVDGSTAPQMVIGAGARIAGASVTLDSSYATKLDPTAILKGSAIFLDSGQISLQLDHPGNLYQTPDGKTTAGMVLSGDTLRTLLSGARSLSLLSYSSIDVYGSGMVGNRNALESLSFHAGEIRGFNTGGGLVTFAARSVVLDNVGSGTAPGAVSPASGSFLFDAGTINLGPNALRIDQVAGVTLNTTGGILLGSVPEQPRVGYRSGATVLPLGGSFSTQGDLTINTPLIAGIVGAGESITSAGTLLMTAPAKPHPTISAGLGVSLTLQGANINANSDILLPSGQLTLHATSGNIAVHASLNADGVAQRFFDRTRYTSGGQITIVADAGSVNIAAGSHISVSAAPGGGDAGTLTVGAQGGTFSAADKTLFGFAGLNGKGGSFSLDVLQLPTLAPSNTILDVGGFTESRIFRVRTQDVAIDGVATSHSFSLAADQGSITVTGKINAGGIQGGFIDLEAFGSVILTPGSLLSVHAQKFNDAGKGGAIRIQAGAPVLHQGVYGGASGAWLDIQAGSTIDLGVDANTAASPGLGNFTGTLHLRAPQFGPSTALDLQVKPIMGTILGASSIGVEGYKIFDLSAGTGSITATTQNTVKSNATAFGSFIGTLTSGGIESRLLAGNPGLDPVFVVQPGAEIVNLTGDLTLSSNWDLASYRYGPKSAPGVLTFRAAGNLVFSGALSDGFVAPTTRAPSPFTTWPLYAFTLKAFNAALPANTQGWSYFLTAGADLSSADVHRVTPTSNLPGGISSIGIYKGSLKLGVDGYGTRGETASSPGLAAITTDAVGTAGTYYQVIRTSTGDIDISTARDIVFANPFATIYTSGVPVVDPKTVRALNDFDVPTVTALDITAGKTILGPAPMPSFFVPQYTMAGGNVTLNAQGNIFRQQKVTTRDPVTNLLVTGYALDTERELPMNWLYRRGYVDPLTGQFGLGKENDVASTTWWVDFSNFFEGVGTLGGGNLTINAGHDIVNVDGLVATNARMPKGAPNAAALLELGGGDLVVRAGHNVDGGVYYVERGQGTIHAGNSITTNSMRSVSTTTLPLAISPDKTTSFDSPQAWLPTTLFLGKASFDVSAGGNVTLGPVANPFLLPAGYMNTFWYKTYFSTYAPTDTVNVTSLSGAVTFRQWAVLANTKVATPLLWDYIQLFAPVTPNSSIFPAGSFQPWLRFDETSTQAFYTVSQLMPPTLRATAFSGNISLVGNITLAPAPLGTLDFVAAGSILGLQQAGTNDSAKPGTNTVYWTYGKINVSDANPDTIPGIATPFAYESLPRVAVNFRGGSANAANSSSLLSFTNIENAFNETGSTQGSIQAKQTLHDQALLHADDLTPVYLYALNGDISDLTLFSPKASRIDAGRDITNISFYLQNSRAKDMSVVSAGRDLLAYNEQSHWRTAATADGNSISAAPPSSDDFSWDPLINGLTGDIQITGPGTLEVLTGRNFDLGIGASRPNGTGVGILSLGNARNPYLPFGGADIVAAAGIGSSYALNGSSLHFSDFISKYLATPAGGRYLSEYAASFLSGDARIPGKSPKLTLASFKALPAEQKDAVALNLFYLILRDAGRDHNLGVVGAYTTGFGAITSLFGATHEQGDITLTSREIKTKSGGNIAVLAPNGQLTVGYDISGNQAVDQGILTEDFGNISIFTNNNVTVGTSRIFTLRGGNEIIWSSAGNIAAGSSSKTVQSAPPTRVLIDPQSGDVQTDLAGLATGGGIGVLATVPGVPIGAVDLIAPVGVIDAGDAGIRATGNLNIAAVTVLNASNIQVSGASVGTPAVSVPSVSVSAPAAPANTSTQNTGQAAAEAEKRREAERTQEVLSSIFDVTVIGYGGGGDADTTEGDDETKRKKTE